MPTITIKSAVLNFENVDPDSKLQISAGYAGVASSTLATDFTITIQIQDNRPGGQLTTLSFNPTKVS
jgi:hypothetical protein